MATNFSTIGLIDGITGSAVVILGIIFGLFFLYQSKKKDAKLLLPLAFVTILAGLLYLGVLLDFLSVILYNQNFPYKNAEVAVVSYIWFPPVMILAVYLATTLEFKQYVKYTVPPFIVLGIIFYILIFSNPTASFHIGFYEKSDPRLVDYNIELTSTAGLFLILMLAPVIIGFTIGLIYNAKRTTGVLRTRFMILSIGAICYGIFGSLEGFYTPSPDVILIIVVIRAGYLFSFWLMYLGLRPTVT